MKLKMQHKFTGSSERAYEPLHTPWYFQDIPQDDEVRKSALFIVHGIGSQLYTETAKELRDGFEDALAGIQEKLNNEILPPPFIYEGYWADYSDIQATFPELWRDFSENEGKFFKSLSEHRVTEPGRTAWWFIGQICRLWSPRTKTISKFGWITGGTVLLMTPLTVFSVLIMLAAKPKIFADVLSDIRIYCDPQGSIERALVQRIDYRVGERLLKLLGLDWNFQTLKPEKQLFICGIPHKFDYVTVMSHSLGTIIAHNVISDILKRIEEYEQKIKALQKSKQPSTEELPPMENIERVKRGLHRFYTMGSPLHNIYLLFENRVRMWPENAGEMFQTIDKDGKKVPRHWWGNFYHAFDPISERIIRPFPLAENLHSKTLFVPGIAHSGYFKDPRVLKYIISRTYERDRCDWKEPEFRSNAQYLLLRLVLMVLVSILAGAALFGLVILITSGGGTVWLAKKALQWIKSIF